MKAWFPASLVLACDGINSAVRDFFTDSNNNSSIKINNRIFQSSSSSSGKVNRGSIGAKTESGGFSKSSTFGLTQLQSDAAGNSSVLVQH